jgi:hypothetical protein
MAARRTGWSVHTEPLKSWQEFLIAGTSRKVDLLGDYYSDPCTKTFVRLQASE